MIETVWNVASVGELTAIAGELIGIWKHKNTTTGIVVALAGDLGAGKTTFVQHVARTLGVTETVSSPTFVIMKSYETEDPIFSSLVHIDAYRIDESSEMVTLGLPTIITSPHTLVCIEWAEKIADLLPTGTVHLKLEVLPNSVHKITHYES
jgi:tRNA threonylcarbamoyladenosine biosynthesis protein TsaE